MEDGMSEAEAVASLDSIDMIVKQVYAERELPIEEGKPAATGKQEAWMENLLLLFYFFHSG